MAGSIDREITVTSKDARSLIASLKETAGNLNGATSELEETLAENREPISDFNNIGLSDLSISLTEARQVIVVLNRDTTDVRHDPSRFILGRQQPRTTAETGMYGHAADWREAGGERRR